MTLQLFELLYFLNGEEFKKNVLTNVVDLVEKNFAEYVNLFKKDSG